MSSSSRKCITHHFACDCREQQWKELEKDLHETVRQLEITSGRLAEVRVTLAEMKSALQDPVLFSERQTIAGLVGLWCGDQEISQTPFNVITALDALGYLCQKEGLPKLESTQ